MTNSSIVKLIAEEAEHYEAHYNDPNQNQDPGNRRVSGAPPRLLTIRLTADQYERVADAAKQADLPVSTLARNALMSAITAQTNTVFSNQIEETLRQVLRPELLRA